MATSSIGSHCSREGQPCSSSKLLNEELRNLLLSLNDLHLPSLSAVHALITRASPLQIQQNLCQGYDCTPKRDLREVSTVLQLWTSILKSQHQHAPDTCSVTSYLNLISFTMIQNSREQPQEHGTLALSGVELLFCHCPGVRSPERVFQWANLDGLPAPLPLTPSHLLPSPDPLRLWNLCK